MATPLAQFWTDEAARLDARLTALDPDLAAQRAVLAAAQGLQALAAQAVASQGLAAEAARKALSGIPMPADGSPLLVALELALVNLADAQAAQAQAELAVRAETAELAARQAQHSALQAGLAEARREATRAARDGLARQALRDALETGTLATLAADATAALADFEATARARVESEFPANAANAKHFLKRARGRRQLVQDSTASAATLAATAFAAAHPALDQARRAYDQAAAAVGEAGAAAPSLEADRQLLARLAALPAASPPDRYPLLTRWQRERLHDPALKSARETALAKLTGVDNAAAALRAAREAYDTQRLAAMAAAPDQSPSELDAGPLSGVHGTLATRASDLQAARATLSADDLAIVKTWFAAVPAPLWDALEQLDLAVARLQALSAPAAPGLPGTPAERLAALDAAETALVAALTAERQAGRTLAGAELAALHAAALLAAERDTAPSRSSAFAHSAALF